MHFKIVGVVILLVGAYLAVSALIANEHQHTDAISAQVYPVIAVFLALVVRVLQAEKHHRDWLKHMVAAEAQAEHHAEHADAESEVAQPS